MSEENKNTEVFVNLRINTDQIDKDLEIVKAKIIEVSEFALEKNVNINLCVGVMLEDSECAFLRELKKDLQKGFKDAKGQYY